MTIRRSKVRVIIPDSHGEHIDRDAARCLVRDIRKLGQVDEIVGLGDHLDAGGTFSTHQRSFTNEMTESYQADIDGANWFLDLVQKAAPNAQLHMIEGNHEQHVERWASRTFASHKDAVNLLEVYGPAKVMQLKARGAKYYKRSEQYMGLSIHGAIRLGKCFFVHGIGASKHAAEVHLARFGANVVYGHTHTAQSHIGRTVTSDGQGAWNVGTLAKLQPLYFHTNPTNWSHGYGVQFVAPSGRFLHINVPIYGGESMLMELASKAA